MSNQLFDIYADPEQRRHQRRIEYLRWQTADVEQMFHIENRQFRGLVALGTKNLVCVFFSLVVLALSVQPRLVA